jgi:hypothetical protein
MYGRFEVHMVVNVEMSLFWDVTPCRLVNTYQLTKFEYLSTVDTVLAIGSCEDGRWMELA